MKTDRELLELAARAAGIVIYWEELYTNSGIEYRPQLEIDGTWGHGEWNPLTDDGDALRLAVTIPGLSLQYVIAAAWQAHDCEYERLAYVRRAITRAAAEIAEGLK